MSADTAQKALEEALKRRRFDPAYYICGEDDFRKEDAMKRLIAEAIEPAMRDFNMDVKRAADFDARSMDAALSALPMLADRRIVLIRDAGTLKKDARKVLEAYLEKPSSDVLVLLVEGAGGKTDKELARKCTLLEFGCLAPDRIPRWIAHYAATEFHMKISPDAVELLHAATGTDLYQLVAELDKLASYAHGREITEADVAAIVGIRRGETMADFLDQVAARNAIPAMALLSHVLTQPKTTGVSLVMALTAQTIALAWGRARLDEGLPSGRLQSEYFSFLKRSGSVMTGRPWGTAVAAWTASVSRWTDKALERSLDALLEADIALKETKISSEEQILATLVLAMCVEDEARIAA